VLRALVFLKSFDNQTTMLTIRAAMSVAIYRVPFTPFLFDNLMG
jgi:hypothetical protein